MPAINSIDIGPAIVPHAIRFGTAAGPPDVTKERKSLISFLLMNDSNVFDSLIFLICNFQ